MLVSDGICSCCCRLVLPLLLVLLLLVRCTLGNTVGDDCRLQCSVVGVLVVSSAAVPTVEVVVAWSVAASAGVCMRKQVQLKVEYQC